MKKSAGKPASPKEQRPESAPADAGERGSGQGSATALARLKKIEQRKDHLRPGRDQDPGGGSR